MADYDNLLPPEIWSVIFTRLPVKLILQCMSVRKSCYSFISNPNFISNYENLNLNKSGNRLLLKLFDRKAHLHYSFISLDKSFANPREHDRDFPERFRGRDLRVVGLCNGLICLALYDPNRTKKDSLVYFLRWNPTIRKTIELPSNNSRPFHYGFGFDSKTSDYKVFCISKDCEIFDLRKGVWRTIIDPNINNSWAVYGQASGCCLDGVAHFTGLSDASYEKSIVAFNMSDEVSREITMPNYAKFTDNIYTVVDLDDRSVDIKIVSFDGLIHVITWKVFLNEIIDMLESCLIWAMKEYSVTESWSKVFDIDLPSAQVLPSTLLDPHMFLLWGNGEVLMTHGLDADGDEYFGNEQELVLYDSESRKSKCLFSIIKLVFDLCFYKESLVLLLGREEDMHMC